MNDKDVEGFRTLDEAKKYLHSDECLERLGVSAKSSRCGELKGFIYLIQLKVNKTQDTYYVNIGSFILYLCHQGVSYLMIDEREVA